MTRFKNSFVFCLLVLCITPAFAAPLKVITSTTDLAWLTKQIGGDEVAVTPLLKGKEDPHYVDAVPRFIHLLADADMVCIVGMDLEIGWMPKVLSRSANAQVQPGGKGDCVSSKSVKALDVISGSIDRSMGDVHPDGNPHFHLSPLHIVQAGETVMGTLLELRPEASESFLLNYEALEQQMTQLHGVIKAKLAPLKEFKIMEYHKEFSYFFDAYGLNSVGALESVPGVPPSAGRLARAALSAKKDKVKLLIAAEHNPKKVLKRFSSISHVPVVTVFTSIQAEGEVNDYAKLQQQIADHLLQVLK